MIDIIDFLRTDVLKVVFSDVGLKNLSIKNPNAAQAVSNVAIKNPVLYFIPTHRIIPVRGLPLCKYGNQSLRERLLALEGHNTDNLRGNYPCTRKKC